jgi:hypothetical protein
VGLNHHTGEPIDPQMEGVFDNYIVKRQIINSGYAPQLFICLLSSTRITKDPANVPSNGSVQPHHCLAAAARG